MIEYPIPEMDASIKVYSALSEMRNKLVTIYDYEKEELPIKKRKKLEETIKTIDKLLKDYL